MTTRSRIGSVQLEEQLIAGIKAGNKDDFSRLISMYQVYALKVAYRFVKDKALAEDVVQESFIKVYQKIQSFEGRSSFKSWLTQVLINTCKNKMRKGGRETSQEMVSFDSQKMGMDMGPERVSIHLDIGDMLMREIDTLPEKQRQALCLRIYEDMSFGEIAEIMGSPYDTAKANYRHALMKLRERLESCDVLKSWMNESAYRPSSWLGEFMEVDA